MCVLSQFPKKGVLLLLAAAFPPHVCLSGGAEGGLSATADPELVGVRSARLGSARHGSVSSVSSAEVRFPTGTQRRRETPTVRQKSTHHREGKVRRETPGATASVEPRAGRQTGAEEEGEESASRGTRSGTRCPWLSWPTPGRRCRWGARQER